MAKFLSTAFVLSTAASMASAYTVTVNGGFMFKNIDPIVSPGQYTSHMHTFFGSDAINATTTTSAELKKGCSTAENLNDFSSYWTPTLYYTKNSNSSADWTPLYPERFSTYYENEADAEIPIPENFKLIVGNPDATSQDQVTNYQGTDPNVIWFCEGDPASPADKQPTAFPATTCSTHLQHLVYFHDCVDPNNLAVSSYSSTKNLPNVNRCPTGQKRMPRLRFSVRYDLRKTISQGWSGAPPLALSCGKSHCAHGDFINGWDTLALKNMMLATDKKEYMYVGGTLQNGTGGAPTCTAKDADPKHGTSDLTESLKTKVGAKKRSATLWEA